MAENEPTKEELVEGARLRGLPVSGTKDELAARIAEHDEAAAEKMPDIAAVIRYELTEEDARAYNTTRDRLSRFLKHTLDGPLPLVRAEAGQIVPFIVVLSGVEGLSGTLLMPGGGMHWIEGVSPFIEED